MKTIHISFLFLLGIGSLHAQSNLNPVIKSTGAVYDVPYAVEKPDPNQEYKIIATIGKEFEMPSEIHPLLSHFARMYNLHVYAGVPKEKLNFVLVFYFKALDAVLDNNTYKAKYNIDNPNLKVIEELKNAGVKVLVCGQSIEVSKIDYRTISQMVGIATSRFTAVTSYQMKGYGYFSF